MGIFKTPSPQKFEYNPRFWNPKREEMEERMKELDQLKSNDVEATKSRISRGLRQGFRMDQELKTKYMRQSNYRLLLIILALLAFSLAFIYVYLPKIEDYIYGGPL